MTRALQQLVAIAFAAAVASGCYTIRYTTNARPEGAPRDEQWQHAFLNGVIVASAPMNVSQVCPRGVAVIENQVTIANSLLSGLVQSALGGLVYERTNALIDPVYGPYSGPAFFVNVQLWNPSTIRVTCAAPEAAPERGPEQR